MKSQLHDYIIYYANMDVIILLKKLFTTYFIIDLK